MSVSRVIRPTVLHNILGYDSQDFDRNLAFGADPNQEEIDFSFHEQVSYS